MKIPRSIYASELPDGQWEVIVGEMGGKQWRTVCGSGDVGLIADRYAIAPNSGCTERSPHRDWKRVETSYALAKTD